MHHGQRLINTLAKVNKPIEGKFIPMICYSGENTDSGNSYCEPLMTSDETYIEKFRDNKLNGLISVDGFDDNENHLYKYQQAEFGSRIESNETFIILNGSNYYDDDDFCNELEHSHDIIRNSSFPEKKIAIMVRRGGCSFAKKAENVALAGAAMMIMLNDDENEIAMGVESDYTASKIHLAALMISKQSAENLVSLLHSQANKGDNKMTITIHPNVNNVSVPVSPEMMTSNKYMIENKLMKE